jgi:16S rRNA processing protein RimM
MEKYLECGAITRIHGLMGALVVNHYCDSYEIFAQLKYIYIKSPNGYEKKKVKKISPYKVGALLTLDGIANADEAMKFRGKTIYADRDDLLKDDDSFFIVDLIGLGVYDYETNEKYGVLDEVANYGAQDVYVIKRDGKANAFIPAVPEFVKKISLEEGIFISPIEGMIE